MAPFRSSRSTRHFDPNTATPRARGGGIDHDPSEGLPVSQWILADVEVKQDPESPNADDVIQQDQSSTSYPYPEHPVPSFFAQLPAHSQELLRRARAGSRRTTTSVYDKKTDSYLNPSTAETKIPKSKNAHRITKPSTHNSPVPVAILPDEENENEENEGEEEDVMLLDGEKKEAGKGNVARTFTVKKWVQVPPALAEKMEEKRYLAPRRPGMPSLYGRGGNAVVAGIDMSVLGVMNGSSGVVNSAGVSGDSNMIATASDSTPLPPATPTRPGRSMPPKRKKRLGGPGRKKAVVVQQQNAENATGESDLVGLPVEGEKHEGEAEGEGSDSESEGSEEGEIEEGGIAEEAQQMRTAEPLEQVVPLPGAEQVVLGETATPPAMAVSMVEDVIVELAAPVPVEPTPEPEETAVKDIVPVVAAPPPVETVPVDMVPEVEVPDEKPTAVQAELQSEEVDLLGSLDAAVNKDMEDAGGLAVPIPADADADATTALPAAAADAADAPAQEPECIG